MFLWYVLDNQISFLSRDLLINCFDNLPDLAAPVWPSFVLVFLTSFSGFKE